MLLFLRTRSSLLLSFLQPVMLTWRRFRQEVTNSLRLSPVMLVLPTSILSRYCSCLARLITPASFRLLQPRKLILRRSLHLWSFPIPVSVTWRHSESEITSRARVPLLPISVINLRNPSAELASSLSYSLTRRSQILYLLMSGYEYATCLFLVSFNKASSLIFSQPSK